LLQFSQAIELIFLMLAVGANIRFHFAPGAGSFLTRNPTLHSTFIFASISAPRGISIPFLTPYIPFKQSYPCHFPTHFQRLPFFLRRVHPERAEYF
jgi:hypothetical protein